MKNVITVCVVIIVFAFIAFAVLFPVFDRVDEGPAAAFRFVILSHDADKAPISNGQRPILYVSWFWGTTAMASRHYLVYPDRHCEDIGVLWHHYHDVRSAPQIGSHDFSALQSVAALPNGLLKPESVPCQQLLIISREQRGQWVTEYYDRRHLPMQAVSIVNLQEKCDSTSGTQFSNLN